MMTVHKAEYFEPKFDIHQTELWLIKFSIVFDF